MTQAHGTDSRGLALSGAGADAIERFDAVIDDLYYYRLGVQDRLDALLQQFPEFVLAHVLKGSWTKGGRPRTVPITTPEQRAVLDAAHRLAGSGSLIPAQTLSSFWTGSRRRSCPLSSRLTRTGPPARRAEDRAQRKDRQLWPSAARLRRDT
jgi:hypothetical protein